jgi:hypothetical protein
MQVLGSAILRLAWRVRSRPKPAPRAHRRPLHDFGAATAGPTLHVGLGTVAPATAEGAHEGMSAGERTAERSNLIDQRIDAPE